MASSALLFPPLLLALLLPQTAESFPAFDLGYAEADLVLIASPKGFAGDRIPLTVHSILKGKVESQRLFVLQPRSYGLHVRLPAKASPHLIFLKKTPSGYFPLQRSGILITVPKGGRRERALHAFFKLLDRAEAFRNERAPKGIETLCRDLTRFATSHTSADPLLAEAALLTLARRPDLAPQLPAKEIRDLQALLADKKLDSKLRDLSARCLAAAKDPQLPDQLLDLLSKDEARGLGTVFGRLLVASSGTQTLEALGIAYKRASKKADAKARFEIRRSLEAFHGPAARKLRDSLR